uniref:Uncharacterized protein n=1 Tax=Leersia perrieri TaxID=77586 RepID=A0A0D9X4W8_9ORYZ
MGEAAAAVSGESAGVRVLAVSRVTPSPPPPTPERVKLSLFDAPWVVLPPIQRVFLYETASPAPSPPAFDVAVERLKRSLAATLSLFLPLAGMLTYVADTGDVVVDCAGAGGVAFVEAEAAGFDAGPLAGDEAHDVAAFVALVPELDARVLPAPVLAVQATRLAGGIAVGVSVHHAVADGRAVWGFMEAWSTAAKVGTSPPVTKGIAAPHYGREAAIPHPADGGERARQLLKLVAPNLPVASGQHDFSQRFRLDRRTFHLDAASIHSLKRRINAAIAAESPKPKPKPVSTFVALAAISWTAFVRAKSLAAGEDTYLAFLADMRTRLNPPVADGYLGNCVKIILAKCADAADLAADAGERGIAAAAMAVQAAVAEMEAAAAAATEGMDREAVERMMRLPYHRLANVAASPRFMAYEAADFGWGSPARVELVSMNHDGEIVLVGGRRDGEVQLSVSIDPAQVDAFKAHLLG